MLFLGSYRQPTTHNPPRFFVPELGVLLFVPTLRVQVLGKNSRPEVRGERYEERDLDLLSGPGGLHPQALPEPEMNLSIHPAPIIQAHSVSP
ncbi:protein of unknown function [Mesotoga infera]|uniref:Uncharacterized protein n=1 Tax=Mesotoga infera TaxID=1236046 RepID=A0A7Z7LDS8_9BACT|nr:protein of unknown function [Mesotoga infera]